MIEFVKGKLVSNAPTKTIIDVHGVGYRASTRRKAMQLGLKGWVQNMRDGTVEAVVEGPEESVDKLIGWCHRGPTSAHVTLVNARKGDATGEFPDFTIRRAIG